MKFGSILELQSCQKRLGQADEQRDKLSARHETELQQMRQVEDAPAPPLRSAHCQLCSLRIVYDFVQTPLLTYHAALA